ncbi:MFS transporter [Sphingobacterium sp. DK4209]|uniref:MFS transporter n=1 Tax=Sphingobacterium zhuxiongii TaxID=2662364 RepID=A0A5Q0Q4K1_9SPHI|nr:MULTISPECIES: MFS transporter [unclassified Sphingobacterium]MVZ66251.1 MFS transporter [Sphingobacterium sp. DK4209]QGA24975.1 MFS transporter [Sphingobacterium sp. dk4302]
MQQPLKRSKPRLSRAQIFNMSFGFFGIQFGFALQTGNASRILQTFGADVEHLSLFWLVAPLSGMLIQPIIGYFSDKTWTRLGRRRPFFLGGALVAAAALALMPNASVLALLIPPLLIGAGMLMIMDVAFNVSMEPFRALVADNLPKEQHGYGYAVQTFLIGAGAIIGSFLPYVLSTYFGVSKVAEQGHVPDNVIWSFYAGAIVLVLSLLWTVITTKEYTAEELQSFEEHQEEEETASHNFFSIFRDFKNMPQAMKQLGLVQFFSWFALFSMWVFTTPAIAQHIYHLPATDTASSAYADAGNLTGVLFGVYNLVATVFALLLPKLYQAIGKKKTHMIALATSGLGLISILFIQNPNLLYIPMIAVGIAWASILATPYSMLSGVVPAKKMGLYMGLFNFFITLPQLVNGVLGTVLVKYVFQHQAVYCLTMAGVFMLLAAVSTRSVKAV